MWRFFYRRGCENVKSEKFLNTLMSQMHQMSASNNLRRCLEGQTFSTDIGISEVYCELRFNSHSNFFFVEYDILLEACFNVSYNLKPRLSQEILKRSPRKPRARLHQVAKKLALEVLYEKN